LSTIGTLRAAALPIASIWGAVVFVMAFALVACGLTSAAHSGWLANFALLGLAALAASRGIAAAATQALRAAGAFTCTTVIYGSGSAGETLAAALAADATSEIRVAGVFDDRLDDRSAVSGAAPHLGSLADLKAYVRRHKVDTVILALPMGAEARVSGLVQRLADLPVDIRLAANASQLQFAPAAYSYIGIVPVIDLANRPISGLDAIAKRALDVVIAALAVIALAPLMLMVAAAVRLESKGPALFRQKRYGFNNELIEVYKFRSMYTDRADATASRLVTKNDPRVTRVGRIIRTSSLDELPQLFNVLAGTLSLVGPRPHAVHAKAADQFYPDVVATYFARHNVKPGITGWAQINGWRGETDTEEKIRQRVAFDLDYIKRWSVGFDLLILVKTPLSLLKTENAY
jgi:Undecaprenyl-phosphate glucose phosphotransferase